MRKNIKYLVSLLIISAGIATNAQDWIVPEDLSARANPMDYILSNVEKGKSLYMLNCKSCHGDPGKNNGLPLVPPPPDVISEQMQANSEGELYFKITYGRAAMPQFETVLSEDERWNVVNFIMNYNAEREALLIEKPPVKAQIWASINEQDASIEIFIESEKEDGNKVNLPEVPVIISTRKIFGNLKIGETVTNQNGRAVFQVPRETIGDEDGKVNIVVSLNEDYEAKPVVLDNAKIATPKNIKGLIRPGVIWSTNDKMPLWLVTSFLGMVIGAWITIFYVIYEIVRIRRMNSTK